MTVDREPRQRGERLTLAGAGEIGELARFDEIDFFGFDEHSRRERKLAGLDPEPHALSHPASEGNHTSANFLRHLPQLPYAMDMRRERRQEKTISGARNQVAQNWFERAFRTRAPYPLDVG